MIVGKRTVSVNVRVPSLCSLTETGGESSNKALKADVIRPPGTLGILYRSYHFERYQLQLLTRTSKTVHIFAVTRPHLRG